MSDARDEDDRRLPPDPAGTQPKVDTSALLPARLVDPPEPEREPADFAFLPEPIIDPDPPAPAAHAPEPPHAAKFQFILGALLAIGVVGLVAFGVIAADRATDAKSPAWSGWKPSADGIAGATQIADHVAPLYKGSNGKQLTAATAHEFEVELEASEVPMKVAVRKRKEEGGQISVVEGDTVLYRLCGLGERCALPGDPTQSRALLLRRQALEMALYTFKYLDGIDQVVLFMPPSFAKAPDKRTKKTINVRLDNQALRFSRSELSVLLDLPLGRTLPSPPPPIKTIKRTPDGQLAFNVTEPRIFTYSMVPGNGEERVFLVLENLTNPEAIVRMQQQELDVRKQAAEAAGGEPVEPTAVE